MRVGLGSFLQESNSFSPTEGSWSHFGPRELLRGEDLLEAFLDTRTELGGATHRLAAEGAELVPLLSARASASAGPLERDMFESILDELLERGRGAGPLDGLLLALHGAMVAEGYLDASGEVLSRLRQLLGAQVPIVATLDLHANVSVRMVEAADALVGYHTAPHVDMWETGERAARLLLSTVRGNARPRQVLRRLPMILPSENGRTTEGPYAEVMRLVEEASGMPGILDASAFSVQPWLDVPDVGCSVLVIGDGTRQRAAEQADLIADAFWQRRRQFEVQLTPTASALASALASQRHPVVLGEPADAPSSGAPGDSTVVLGLLLPVQPEKDVLLNVVDPQAARAMAQAGVGRTVSVRVGGYSRVPFYGPLEVTGQVRRLTDGDFVHKGPGMQGMTSHMGLTGVLQVGHVFLVVMERPVLQWDPELYRSVGLEPREAQVVVVKSPAAFRAAYEALAAEVVLIDAPGVCSPELRSLPFRHVRRPLYPLDDPKHWREC